jgi:hypothetical protein
MTKSSRKLLIALGIVLIFGAIRILTSDPVEDDILPTEDLSASMALIETERVLFGVQKINNLKLDASFFTDVRFKTLEDFRITIEDVRTGRTNPFTPVQE